jgi:solute carrier family 39 (zinc transporter), member 1/2/3
VTLVFYKGIAALLIFLASIASVIYPLKKKSLLKHTESIEMGEALASGIFLGAAFFHMLPDSIKAFAKIYGDLTYPIPEAICVFGFVFLLLLERLSLFTNATTPKNSIPYVLAIILTIHAIIEGAALGIGSTFSETFMLFIAIVAHKGTESFALCITMMRHQLPHSRVIAIILFFSIMTPLGILLGTIINLYTFARSGEIVEAVFNAFAAGTFLYISTLHHIHFHQHTEDARGLLEFASLLLGIVLMGLIAVWT